MPIDYAALKTEIQSDPAAIGYAAAVGAGSDVSIAGLLNARGSTAAFDVFRNDIRIGEVVNAIVPADFANMTQLQVSKLNLLFAGSATIDATSANTRTIFAGIFSGMASTVAALTALASRKGSRAEVLFGVGTVVTASDVSFALRGKA